MKRVHEIELESRQERIRAKKDIMGVKRLMTTPICAPFTPHRSGRRVYVICGDLELRKTFISNLQNLSGRAKEVYNRWKQGDFSLPFPLGLFPPGMPKLANPLSIEAAVSELW